MLIGFAESFNATYCCAHCLITREALKHTIGLSEVQMRTNEHFFEAFDQIPSEEQHSQDFLVRSQGIYRRSEVLRLKFFKLPDCIGADIFHDIDEGIGKDLFNFTTNFLVSSGNITMEEISNRILSFDYGRLDIDSRPSNINHLSGIQMRNILYRFNFMFYGVVEFHFFEATSIMSRILQLVHSNVIHTRNIDLLRTLITRFKEIWHNVWEQIIKPKLHFFDHYPDLIEKIGPLVLCDTAAYEKHHRILTRVVEKNPQFKNILKSLSERHQTLWAQSWKKTDF